MNVEPTFKGEMQLAGWQESHTGGAKVVMWLPDTESLDVFRGLTTKRGNKAGQRFMAVLVEIGDDEMPQAPDKPKGGELARLAGRWCSNPDFYEWIRPIYDRALGGNGNGHGDVCLEDFGGKVSDFCRHAMLVMIGGDIESRAELDHDADAAQRFHRLIREPFMQWCRENGVTL